MRPVLAVAIALAIVALTACGGSGHHQSSGSPAAHLLTTDEADRLAVARLHTYDAHFVNLDMTVPDAGETLHILGRADMQKLEAYGLVESSAGPSQAALLQWTPEGKAALPTAATALPAAPPLTGWQAAAMVPSDPLDQVLRVTLALSSDRPENPLLLQQDGGRLVGTATVAGRPVDVFTAPGANNKPSDLLRYYVDAGGNLLEVQADTGQSAPAVILLTPSTSDAPIPLVSALS